MVSRLTVSCVLIASAGLMAVACGDDEGSGGDPVSGTAGSTAGRGTVVSGNGGRGSAGMTGATPGRGGRGQMTCPAGEPATGGACMPGSGDCRYGSRMCDCLSESSTWVCWAMSDCPTVTPAEQSACPAVGISCDLAAGGECECEDTGWNCGNQFCPPAEPAVATECDEGRGMCPYGERTCECADDVWACWSPADCPTTPPVNRSMCPMVGVSCTYEGGDCACRGSGWRCDRGVPQPMPTDDAGTEMPPAP